MDDRAEVYGIGGHAYADLLHGNAIHTYSAPGYDYAVEKAGQTSGWSFTIYEENWNYGFPQEMAHFVDCVRDDKPPIVSGEDGRAVARDHHGRLRLGRQRPEDRASVQDRCQEADRPVAAVKESAQCADHFFFFFF